MQYNRSIVLSIAGYDPSGGAGILADIKTFEQHECLGMAVVSANTSQTEDLCFSVEWRLVEQMQDELAPLLERYQIQWVKIGMIQNIHVLIEICRFLKTYNSEIKIIWDSVLSASNGIHFMDKWNAAELTQLYSELYLITPNTNELTALTGIKEEADAAQSIADHCPVLLTGGHRKSSKGTDVLFYNNQCINIEPDIAHFRDKHGTGCILSAAILANLANEFSLEEACRKAKTYIEKVVNTNQNKLAYHYDTK